MSQLADALTAAHPHWGQLPHELLRAFDWMHEQGWEAGNGRVVYATPYAGEWQTGTVFRSDLTLEGWLDDEAASQQLLPYAEADGAGGMVALWRASESDVKVVLIDGLDRLTLAESPLEFLRLVAIGHDELKSFSVSQRPSAESAQAHAGFRSWVERTFGVSVPEAWDDLGADAFTDWWDEATGQDGAPVSTTENPDKASGQTSVTGAITTLLDLLGSPDGPEAAAALGEFVGVELGDKVRSTSRRLKKTGLEVEVERGRVETIWVHVSLGRSIGYGLPPTEHTWWSGPDLIDGLTKESTMKQVGALLGDPESEGKSYLRYRVDEKFLHLAFGETDLLAGITLMMRVP